MHARESVLPSESAICASRLCLGALGTRARASDDEAAAAFYVRRSIYITVASLLFRRSSSFASDGEGGREGGMERSGEPKDLCIVTILRLLANATLSHTYRDLQ